MLWRGQSANIRESQLYLMGFNLRNGLRYMGGDKALYGKVLRDFHSILQEKETALKDFLQKGGYARLYDYCAFIERKCQKRGSG